MPGAGPVRRQALVCRVVGRLVALPIAAVLETMRPLPVQPLPGLPGYVAGVAMIRGAGVPVVDLAVLFGAGWVSTGGGTTGEGAPADSPVSTDAPVRRRQRRSAGRFVTLALPDRRTLALAVDAVLDVRELDQATTGHLPTLLAGVERGLLASLGSVEEELLYLLQTAHLVDDAVWAALAPAPAPAGAS